MAGQWQTHGAGIPASPHTQPTMGHCRTKTNPNIPQFPKARIPQPKQGMRIRFSVANNGLCGFDASLCGNSLREPRGRKIVQPRKTRNTRKGEHEGEGEAPAEPLLANPITQHYSPLPFLSFILYVLSFPSTPLRSRTKRAQRRGEGEPSPPGWSFFVR